jgi:hypothetical protein
MQGLEENTTTNGHKASSQPGLLNPKNRGVGVEEVEFP